MPYVARSPSGRDKKMFVIGIVAGAMLSFFGSYIATASFRIIDKGLSIENIVFLIIGLACFIVLLYKLPSIVKKL